MNPMYLPQFPHLIVLAITTLTAQASIPQWDAARKSYDEGQFATATGLYLDISEKENSRGKTEALLLATRSAARQGDSEKTRSIAERIPAGPHAEFAKMVALESSKSWVELLAVADQTIVETWPEKLIYPALLMRGDAYIQLTDYAAATRAFATAQNYTISPSTAARAALFEGGAAQKAGVTPDELLAIYQKIIDLAPRGGGLVPRAHMARARLLAEQGNEAKAMNEVKAMHVFRERDPFWIVAVELTTAQVYEALGALDSAKKHYDNVIAFAEPPADLLSEARAGSARVDRTSR